MSFKIVLLGPDVDASWPQKIRQAVPGAVAGAFRDPQEALVEIEDADAAYGTAPPGLLARAKKLHWICAAGAGRGGDWFYDALEKNDVVVTNMRAATTSTSRLTPWRSCSPSRDDSTTTCRRSSGRRARA